VYIHRRTDGNDRIIPHVVRNNNAYLNDRVVYDRTNVDGWNIANAAAAGVLIKHAATCGRFLRNRLYQCMLDL